MPPGESVTTTGTFHSYFDDGDSAAVIHECPGHAKASNSVTCCCGDCWEQTPCNCPRTHPCVLCLKGEPPEQSMLRAIAVNYSHEQRHPEGPQ